MIRQTWCQMGMPITVCLANAGAGQADIDAVMSWLASVDERFSPYLATSEVSRINRMNAGGCESGQLSDEMLTILRLCEQTKQETNGYFDAVRSGVFDPSGLVKGWAIERASALLSARGLTNHIVEAGGDAQVVGHNAERQPWRVGIRNPFRRDEQVKILALSGRGIATSGTAVRGRHIDNPLTGAAVETDLVSLTVIAATVYEADRFATAAFAMGRDGLAFIAGRPGLEGYAIHADGIATATRGFSGYAG